MIELAKLTRETVKNLQQGEQVTVKLPSPGAVFSARATVSQCKILYGVTYTTSSDFNNNSITIRRV